jgi:hypothetical protein
MEYREFKDIRLINPEDKTQEKDKLVNLHRSHRKHQIILTAKKI